MEKQTEILFEPISHTYSDNTGAIYTSATTLISKYKEPFNKKYWSMYTALKDSGVRVRPVDGLKGIIVNGQFRGLDSLYRNPISSYGVDRLIAKWKDMTEKACARGNKVHDYLEDSINESKGDIKGVTNKLITPNLHIQGLAEIRTKHDLDTTTIGDTYPEIYKRLLGYINLGCVLYAEKRVYTTNFKVAGMIDVLVVNLRTKQFAIVDWKTNKDIMMFRSGYFKKEYVNGAWVKGSQFIDKKSYLLHPIGHIEECKGMIYSLQLSLYAYIMILWGYKLVKDGLEIFHIRPEMRPKLIKVPFLQNEIKLILQHHLDTKVNAPQQPQQGMFGIT